MASYTAHVTGITWDGTNGAAILAAVHEFYGLGTGDLISLNTTQLSTQGYVSTALVIQPAPSATNNVWVWAYNHGDTVILNPPQHMVLSPAELARWFDAVPE